MPQLVICHKCGATLFESKDELTPLEDIIQMCDGRCPACKKRLSSMPRNIEVKPVSVPNRINPFEPEKKSSKKESSSRTKKRERKRSGYVSSKPRSAGIWGTG